MAENQSRVCDTLTKKEVKLIHACTTLANPRTRKRELSALEMVMESFDVRESWLVTTDEEETVETDAGIVHVIPPWR